MMKGRAHILLIFLILPLCITGHDEWNYEDQDEWGGMCNVGHQQSPIDIDASYVRYNKTIHGLIFHYDEEEYTASIRLRHHSVELRFGDATRNLRISGGNLIGDYVLDNIHFHWPSEHTINGQRFEMEAHFVHYSSRFSSVVEALTQPEGVAVVAVLFAEHEHGLVLDFLDELPEEGETSTAEVSPYALLPPGSTRVWTYSGSLTTPQCTEGIRWLVCADPNYATHIPIYGPNARELQPLNHRIVSEWIG